MMYMPSIFGDNLFDEFMKDPFDEMKRLTKDADPRTASLMLRTDIKEVGDSYEMEMDLPGYKKEDLSLGLKNGVLTVTAVRKSENENKDENGRYIRRERYYGSCTRSFYVGKNLHQDDIKARFENGVLSLTFPKNAPQVEENHTIAIEG